MFVESGSFMARSEERDLSQKGHVIMSNKTEDGGYNGFCLLNPEVAPKDARPVEYWCACGAPITEEDDGVCDLCALEYMADQVEAADEEAWLDSQMDR